jgi:hypothetical protein
MISWLDDNPAGKVLAATAGGLGVIMAVLAVVWTLPPTGSDTENPDDGNSPSGEIPQLQSAGPIEEFAVITERPVFNDTRQPVLVLDSDEEQDGENLEEVDVEAPEVELAGVVITPTLRVATLRLKGEDASLIAFEGQPLEGSFGSWQVSEVQARYVVMTSGDGEEVRLDLQIHDAIIDEPPKPVASPSDVTAIDGDAPDQDGETQPMSRAEEIRQRIAERREELRRAAEESGEQPAKPADYRSAINQLMQNRRDQASDENDQ